MVTQTLIPFGTSAVVYINTARLGLSTLVPQEVPREAGTPPQLELRPQNSTGWVSEPGDCSALANTNKDIP